MNLSRRSDSGTGIDPGSTSGTGPTSDPGSTRDPRPARSPSQGPTRMTFDSAFLRRLEQLRLNAFRPMSPLGERPGSLRMPASDVVDHRPYSPGDEIRHIDWHALARHDEVIVRLGHVTRGADVSLVLDLSPSMAIDDNKWRLSLEVAAALGWIAIVGGDRVRLFLMDETAGETWRGPAQAPAFLDRITQLVPGSSGSRLGPALEHVRSEEGRGGLLVVISDLWLEDDFDASIAPLAAPRWETHIVHVLSAGELEPTFSGPIALRDSETGERLEFVIDPDLLATYRLRLRERIDHLAAACALRGASHALVRADSSLEGVVLPLLRRRALLV